MNNKYKKLTSFASVSVVLLFIYVVLDMMYADISIGRNVFYVYLGIWGFTIIYALILSVKLMENSNKPGFEPDFEAAHKAKKKLIGIYIVHYILQAYLMASMGRWWYWSTLSAMFLLDYFGSKGMFFVMFATSAELIIPTVKVIKRGYAANKFSAKDTVLPILSTVFLLIFILDLVGTKLLQNWYKENKDL